MSEDLTCRHCLADLRSIPLTIDGSGKFYQRTIGVEIQGVYDGMLFYQCPDCGGRWHRFPEGHPLRVRAAPYVRGVYQPAKPGDTPGELVPGEGDTPQVIEAFANAG